VSDSASVDLSAHMAELGSMSESLGEMLAAQDDSDRFFADVLGKFDSILAEFTREQQRWQNECAEREKALALEAEAIARQKQELEELRARLVDEASRARAEGTAAPADASPLEPLLAETRREQAALGQAVAEATKRIAEVAQAVAELAAREPAGGKSIESSDAESSDAVRRERAEARHEQTVLETELEAVRARAAELTEALEAQRREAAENHAQWVDELRRQRLLLEDLARLVVERSSSSAASSAAAPTPGAPVPDVQAADSALESVMAQFEMLQRDVARRRSKAAKSQAESE